MPPVPEHDAWKLFLLRALAAGELVFRSRPSLAVEDLRSIRNFLFLQYDTPLGSAVHATPLFEAIRQQIPYAHISVAASKMAASVLRYSPFVDRCVVTPDPWQDFRGALRAVRELYKSLPKGPVCLATTLGNQRTRLVFLAMLTGKAVRAGYTLAMPLYDLPLPVRQDRPQIECNVDILRALGHGVSAPGPRVFFSREEANYAFEALSHAAVDKTCPRIAFVTQNSGGQHNQWRAERFQQVIGTLSSTLGALPVFVGSAAEAEKIDALRQPLAAPSISLAGKTTVPQMAAVLAQCDLVVSLDTGSFHVARAVQLPGVVMAPAWQDPIEWLPIADPQYRVLRGAPILEETATPFMDEISAEQVIAATEDLLQRYPPSVDARNGRLCHALCNNRPTVSL
jgi:ADP-heptose:LPS heptosyltransferase